MGRLAILLFASTTVIVFQNCTKVGFNDGSSDALSSLGTTSPICDPLGDSQAVTAQQGIAATLLYVPLASQNASTLGSYDDLLSQAVTSSSSIYLSQLNVPTRAWTEGFSNDGANELTDSDGNALLEYFALQMQTTLKLQTADASGYYQFATISDDGAIVSANVNGGNVTLAGSTGAWHSTKSECGTNSLYLDQMSAVELNMAYYQGPRTEIAAVVLWRKMSGPTDFNQTECGVIDENFFTDGVFNKMQSAGWKVIPTANFYLPQGSGMNPCSTAN